MVFKFIRESREQRAIKKLLDENPIVKAASSEMLARLNDPGYVYFNHCSDEAKRTELEGLIKVAFEIVEAENSFMKLRERFSSFVLTMTKYEVLIKTAYDPAGKPIVFVINPAISWELYKHIAAIRQRDKDIRELAFAAGDPSDDDLLGMILLRYENYHAFVCALNAIRRVMKDQHTDPDKDWLQPFRTAMCIWWEHHYRTEIGIPPLISALESLNYSTYMNIVVAGHRFPNLEWKLLATDGAAGRQS